MAMPANPVDAILDPLVSRLKELDADREKLKQDISDFATDMGFHLFTTLEASPDPNMQNYGREILHLSAIFAKTTAASTVAMIDQNRHLLSQGPNTSLAQYAEAAKEAGLPLVDLVRGAAFASVGGFFRECMKTSWLRANIPRDVPQEQFVGKRISTNLAHTPTAVGLHYVRLEGTSALTRAHLELSKVPADVMAAQLEEVRQLHMDFFRFSSRPAQRSAKPGVPPGTNLH